VPVGNRYFGVFQDGSIKIRGLEARRRDTPAWVAAMQTALIEHLAQAPDADHLRERLPGAFELLRQGLRRLRAGQVPPEDLLVAQKLSRVLEKYTSPSPAARAAMQLRRAGKEVQPGQRVPFLYVRGAEKVWAWDRPEPFDSRRLASPRRTWPCASTETPPRFHCPSPQKRCGAPARRGKQPCRQNRPSRRFRSCRMRRSAAPMCQPTAPLDKLSQGNGRSAHAIGAQPPGRPPVAPKTAVSSA
jgi:hypothetical protein